MKDRIVSVIWQTDGMATLNLVFNGQPRHTVVTRERAQQAVLELKVPAYNEWERSK